jgi:hypothetical protein
MAREDAVLAAAKLCAAVGTNNHEREGIMTNVTEGTADERGAAASQSADLEIDAYEPWEPWETSLVLWSIGLGIAGLVVLGILVNIFIL